MASASSLLRLELGVLQHVVSGEQRYEHQWYQLEVKACYGEALLYTSNNVYGKIQPYSKDSVQLH